MIRGEFLSGLGQGGAQACQWTPRAWLQEASPGLTTPPLTPSPGVCSWTSTLCPGSVAIHIRRGGRPLLSYQPTSFHRSGRYFYSKTERENVHSTIMTRGDIEWVLLTPLALSYALCAPYLLSGAQGPPREGTSTVSIPHAGVPRCRRRLTRSRSCSQSLTEPGFGRTRPGPPACAPQPRTAAAVVTGSKRHLERNEPSVGRDEVGTKAGPDLQDSGNTSRTRHTGTSRGSLLGLFLERTGVGSPSRADRGAGAGSGCLRRSPLPPFSFPTLPN